MLCLIFIERMVAAFLAESERQTEVYLRVMLLQLGAVIFISYIFL